MPHLTEACGMGDYVSELFWQSLEALPTAFGETWVTVIIWLLISAFLWGIPKLRDWLAGIMTQPKLRREAGRFIFVWACVLTFVFGWKFLEAAYKRDVAKNDQITAIKEQVVGLTNENKEIPNLRNELIVQESR